MRSELTYYELLQNQNKKVEIRKTWTKSKKQMQKRVGCAATCGKAENKHQDRRLIIITMKRPFFSQI